jgi:hypothetical protein
MRGNLPGLATICISVVAMWLPIGRKRRGLGLCLLMGAILVFGVVGCGGNSGSGGGHTDAGTPAGVYTLVVTATSGTASHTMNVMVTVK